MSEDVRIRLDHIVEKGLSVIVGDANGVDKAVQRYFGDSGYRRVTVFCMKGACRNNLGKWPIQEIAAEPMQKGFAYYSMKDAAMADEATVGFMIWDARSRGTLENIRRLVDQRKTVVVYLAHLKEFYNVRTASDLARLMAFEGGKPELHACAVARSLGTLDKRSSTQTLLF